MVKIIWALVAINSIGLIIFIGAYFVLNNGRHVDYQEKGWTFILAAIGLLVILLAAIPLRYSQSTGTIIFSGIFALLPVAIFMGTFISKRIDALKHKPTFAETYYKDKAQRRIAAAIEQNDTTLLKELIKGQNLNIQGTRVWDVDGLNYLEFAVRLRSNSSFFPFNNEANMTAMRILIDNGIATTPALAEATKYLSKEQLLVLLDAGADPNRSGFISAEPLLFDVISSDSMQNDIAVLLIQKGANVDAKNYDKYTPVMFAAYRAGTSVSWADAWRLVRYLLEEAHADYTYVSPAGISLNSIVQAIGSEANDKNISMPTNFYKVVYWLKEHHAESLTIKK